MPWLSPSRVAGELITAAEWNARIQELSATFGTTAEQMTRAVEAMGEALRATGETIAAAFAPLQTGELHSSLAEIECPSVRKKRTILLED